VTRWRPRGSRIETSRECCRSVPTRQRRQGGEGASRSPRPPHSDES
jgi:hypothetical protein